MSLISIRVFLYISILLAKWTVKPITDARQQQKEFISDASHELKTLLTVIIYQCQIALATSNERYESKVINR